MLRHSPAGSIVELDRVGVRIGGRTVLDDVSLVMQPGHWYGLVGANGCGKTTLMRVVVGLLRPGSGTVRLLDGRPWPRPGDVGVAFGPRLMHPRRRAYTELALRVAALGGGRDRTEAAWQRTGLTDRRLRCGDLSLGQAQRLSVVGALLGSPRLVILDEPTVGLDAEATDWLRSAVGGYVRAGGCAWVSSHDLSELERSADRVLVLDAGRLIFDGAVAALTGSRAPAVVVRSSRPELLAAVVLAAGIAADRDSDGEVVIHGESPDRVGELLAEHRVPVVRMGIRAQTLETSVHKLRAGAGA